MDRPKWGFFLYADGGPRLWHQRLVLGRAGSSETDLVIVSPDFDVYVEEANLWAGDLAAMRFSEEQWPPPPGVSRDETYRFNFRALTASKMRELRVEGETVASQHLRALARARGEPYRVPPGGALVPLEDDLVAPRSDALKATGLPDIRNEVWVHIETTPHGRRGDQVLVTGDEVIRGDVGLKLMCDDWIAIRRLNPEELDGFSGREGSGDARLLDLATIGKTRVTRPWRDVCDRLSPEEFEDWPVHGPRTVRWCCAFINRRGGGPGDHHRWWVASHRLSAEDWGAQLHETVLKQVETLGTYDGLDLVNLAGVEMMLRQAQLVEYAYAQDSAVGYSEVQAQTGGHDKGKKTGSGREKDEGGGRFTLVHEAAVFAGNHRDSGSYMICPDLLDYVGREIERDASVLKQVRKAREERRLLARPSS